MPSLRLFDLLHFFTISLRSVAWDDVVFPVFVCVCVCVCVAGYYCYNTVASVSAAAATEGARGMLDRYQHDWERLVLAAASPQRGVVASSSSTWNIVVLCRLLEVVYLGVVRCPSVVERLPPKQWLRNGFIDSVALLAAEGSCAVDRNEALFSVTSSSSNVVVVSPAVIRHWRMRFIEVCVCGDAPPLDKLLRGKALAGTRDDKRGRIPRNSSSATAPLEPFISQETLLEITGRCMARLGTFVGRTDTYTFTAAAKEMMGQPAVLLHHHEHEPPPPSSVGSTFERFFEKDLRMPSLPEAHLQLDILDILLPLFADVDRSRLPSALTETSSVMLRLVDLLFCLRTFPEIGVGPSLVESIQNEGGGSQFARAQRLWTTSGRTLVLKRLRTDDQRLFLLSSLKWLRESFSIGGGGGGGGIGGGVQEAFEEEAGEHTTPPPPGGAATTGVLDMSSFSATSWLAQFRELVDIMQECTELSGGGGVAAAASGAMVQKRMNRDMARMLHRSGISDKNVWQSARLGCIPTCSSENEGSSSENKGSSSGNKGPDFKRCAVVLQRLVECVHDLFLGHWSMSNGIILDGPSLASILLVHNHEEEDEDDLRVTGAAHHESDKDDGSTSTTFDVVLAWEIMQMSILNRFRTHRVGEISALLPVHFLEEHFIETQSPELVQGRSGSEVGRTHITHEHGDDAVVLNRNTSSFLNLVLLLAESKMKELIAQSEQSEHSATEMILSLCCKFYEVALDRTTEILTREELAVAVCVCASSLTGTGRRSSNVNVETPDVQKCDHRLFACYTSRICMVKSVLQPFLRVQAQGGRPFFKSVDCRFLAEGVLLHIFKPLLVKGKLDHQEASCGGSSKAILDVFQAVAPMLSLATTTSLEKEQNDDDFSDDDSDDEGDIFREEVKTSLSVQTIGRKYLQDLGRMRAEQVSAASPVEAAELAYKLEILASCFGKSAVIGEKEIASLFSLCAFVKSLLFEFSTLVSGADTTTGFPTEASTVFEACRTALQSSLIDVKMVAALKKLMNICMVHIPDVLSETEWAMIQAFATSDWCTSKQVMTDALPVSSSSSRADAAVPVFLTNLDYDSLFRSIGLLEELERHRRVQSIPAVGLADVLSFFVHILQAVACDRETTLHPPDRATCALIDRHCCKLMFDKLLHFLPNVLPGISALPGAGENVTFLYELLLSSTSTHVQLAAFYVLRAGLHHHHQMSSSPSSSGVERGLYTHSDGRAETVTVVKTLSDAEGGGYTIYIPSLGRERLTTRDRFRLWVVGEEEQHSETETDAIARKLLPTQLFPMLFKLTQLCAQTSDFDKSSDSVIDLLAHRDNAMLFVWLLFLEHVKQAKKDALSEDSVIPRDALAHFARDHDFGFSVLRDCFRLIEEVSGGGRESDKGSAATQVGIARHITDQSKLFEEGGQSYTQLLPFTTGKDVPCKHSRLTGLASYVFFKTVRSLPALVRAWWNDHCDPAERAVVRDYMQKNLSAFIIRAEIQEIDQGAKDKLWDDSEVTIKGSPISREVTAALTYEDCSLEMVVELPQAFPLADVKVSCTKKVGIPEKRWRLWELQMKKLLWSQDGSVLDVVLLWKANVEKEFEGKEACLICCSILDPKTKALPSMKCRSCGQVLLIPRIPFYTVKTRTFFPTRFLLSASGVSFILPLPMVQHIQKEQVSLNYCSVFTLSSLTYRDFVEYSVGSFLFLLRCPHCQQPWYTGG